MAKTGNIKRERSRAYAQLQRIEGAPDEDLRRVAAIARLMDTAFRIPGTRIRIGWDAIVGLIPGAGDFLVAAPLLYFLYVAHRRGLPRSVMARMAWNQLVDFAIGSIPLVGDLFDVAHRSNAKNARLIEDHLLRQARGRP